MKGSKKKLCTLRSSLRKTVLTLCLLLIACFLTHSQDTSRITTISDTTSVPTISITSDQLRTANLIFAEHKELSQIVPLLQQENSNLQTINETWERTDSLKTVQLSTQSQIISQQSQDIERLNKSLRISTSVGGTAVGLSIVVTVLCLLLK